MWYSTRKGRFLYDAHAESGSEVGSEAGEALRDELRVSPFLPNRTWQAEEERESCDAAYLAGQSQFLQATASGTTSRTRTQRLSECSRLFKCY